MYISMQLETYEVDEYYIEKGRALTENLKQHSNQKSPILQGGVLEGKIISANCFPLVPADIFISHSHKD